MDEFYKLFDDNWYVFSHRFKELETKGLFIISPLEHLPGSHKYELTKKGKLRIMELLNERSNAIDLNLTQLRNERNLAKVPRPGIFRRIAGFFSLIPTRLTDKHPGKIELTVPGKGNSISTY